MGYEIAVEHVDKFFGANHVLKDISLKIAPGEFVALVGKSGCGKSTLLRLISSLETPSKGSILINGKKTGEIDSDVRFLFQDPRLLPWKSVLENVILGSPDRNREKALRALKEVDLSGKENAWPSDLSGGQRQRVALARALVGTPKVLLLDEPLSALDALTRLNMQQLIEKLWQEWNFTVILVTHDVGEAVNLADRVVLIEDGHIQLDEKIQLARPRFQSTDKAYYENKILSRIMHPVEKPAPEYVI